MTSDWVELDPPAWVVPLTVTSAEADNLAYGLRKLGGPPVAYVRGGRMRTKAGLLQEVGAALQFPDYVGDTWDSYDEALCDLSWLGGDGLVLVCTSAGDVLADEPQHGATWAELLVTAREAWRHPVEQETLRMEPRPFTVVLQDTSEQLTALAARLVGLPVHLP